MKTFTKQIGQRIACILTIGFTMLCLQVNLAVAQSFSAPVEVSFDSGSYKPTLIDLNKDGKPDLFVYYAGFAKAYLNNGDGTFAPPVQVSFGAVEGYTPTLVDLNGDGKPDLFVYYTGYAKAYLNNGDGTFAPPVEVSFGAVEGYTPTLIDLNKDGKPDLFVYYAGFAKAYLNNGDGTFAPPVQVSFGAVEGYTPTLVDLNGDGKPDLFVYYTGYAKAYLNVIGTANVTGGVSLQGWTGAPQPLTFTLTPTGNTTGGVTTQTLTPSATGAFTLTNVPAGTYTLGIKGARWLQKDMAVDATGGNVSVLAVSLYGGDVNGDGVINGADISAASAAFRSRSGDANWNAAADVNGDGVVNGADISLISANFRKRGDP